MFERVYLAPHTEEQHATARDVIRKIFQHFADTPEAVPDGPGDLDQRVADYVAGMTDRFALAYAERI
jgi:dGTP triphosphohydrolase